MDLAAIAKAAIDLGVIPALALFLIVSMHRQNKRLTDMVEKREENNLTMIKILMGEVIAARKGTGQDKGLE
jgi:hypothetical protein